jgi:hypothetical protein
MRSSVCPRSWKLSSFFACHDHLMATAEDDLSAAKLQFELGDTEAIPACIRTLLGGCWATQSASPDAEARLGAIVEFFSQQDESVALILDTTVFDIFSAITAFSSSLPLLVNDFLSIVAQKCNPREVVTMILVALDRHAG